MNPPALINLRGRQATPPAVPPERGVPLDVASVGGDNLEQGQRQRVRHDCQDDVVQVPASRQSLGVLAVCDAAESRITQTRTLDEVASYRPTSTGDVDDALQHVGETLPFVVERGADHAANFNGQAIQFGQRFICRCRVLLAAARLHIDVQDGRDAFRLDGWPGRHFRRNVWACRYVVLRLPLVLLAKRVQWELASSDAPSPERLHRNRRLTEAKVPDRRVNRAKPLHERNEQRTA